MRSFLQETRLAHPSQILRVNRRRGFVRKLVNGSSLYLRCDSYADWAYGGALATIRTDDLAAVPIRALIERNPGVDWALLDDVLYGCANQSGEDNRNVARMALLLAGLPKEVPGATVNRLCGSSMEAVADAARAIKMWRAEFVFAGGVESMTRAPFVMG